MNAQLTSIVRVLDQLVATQQHGAWDYVHIAVTGLTLCVVVWYTIETYRLRMVGQSQTAETAKLLSEAQRQNEVWANLLQETERQNEVAVMPIVGVTVEAVAGEAGRIVLVNVGLGPAFNVTIDHLDFDGKKLGVKHGSTVLRPGQEDELQFHFVERESGSLLNAKTLCEWIKAKRIPTGFNVVIRCKSVNSRVYAFRFNFTSQADKLYIDYEGAVAA